MDIIQNKKNFHHGEGLPPGDLLDLSQSSDTKSSISVFHYDKGKLDQKENCGSRAALEYVGKEGVTWIRVNGIARGELSEVCEGLQVHTLAREDLFSANSRPKFEEYGKCLFLVAKAAILSPDRKNVIIEQVSFWVGSGFILTVQESDKPLFHPVVKRLENENSRIRERDSMYLLFAFLDVINDHFMTALDIFENDIMKLEETILQDVDAIEANALYRLKRTVIRLLRIVSPMHDKANRLVLLDHHLANKENHYFFRDLADYTRRMYERVDHDRMLLVNVQEYYHSQQDYKVSQVTKVLTVIATLFLPLTFIAGVYGMNFDRTKSPWNMPELYWYYGYPACLLFMALIFVSLLFWFRRRKWV